MAHTDPPLPAEGGCRCGKLRFRVSKPALFASACHCTGCQRMTGSAFSLTCSLSADGFEVTEGTPVIGGLRGPDTHHHHCDHCKSWVYSVTAGVPFVDLRATLLDDPSGFEPFIEVHLAEKLPWVVPAADRCFDKEPDGPAWPDLMRAFAERA